MTADKNTLYLVDGSGYIFRAYYAMAYSGGGSLTNPEGTPVGAVYGFTNMMMKLLDDHKEAVIAVIFDAARANFRNDIYEDYKANRDETPEDLIPQFPLVREATEALGIPAVELEGYEADDLIATYAQQAVAQGKNVIIISSDKDLMQLVTDDISMMDPMKNKMIDPKGVVEKFGVTPDKVVDVQSLAGDSVDNVPGVPGIGVKTAAQLINEYGSLEELLNRAEEIKQPKRREKLIENADMARISQQLVRLAQDAPVPMPLEQFTHHDPTMPDLKAFLQKQGFKSMLTRLGDTVSNDTAEQSADIKTEELPAISENEYTLITDIDTLKEWIEDAYQTSVLAIDTETTHLTPAIAKLVGISICSTIGKAAYIPLTHVPEEVDLLGESKGDLVQIPFDDAINALKPLLEDPSVLKVGQNIKYDWQMFKKHGIHMAPCDDTMLISYTVDGTSHSNSMDGLSKLFLDHEPIKYEEVAGKGKNQVTFDKVDVDKARDYAAEDADITHRLHHTFKPRVAREKMARVYEDIERPLVSVIGQMELDGIKVDQLILKEMSSDFAKKIQELEKEIHTEAGTEFNIGSPKQIGEILFDQMGLSGGKKNQDRPMVN